MFKNTVGQENDVMTNFNGSFNMIPSLGHYNRWSGNFKRLGIGLIILLTASAVFAGKSYIENPGTYRARLRALQPGDHLQLMPGEYRHGLPIHHLQGSEEAPIIISGPENGTRAVLLGRPGHNTVSIINSSYVTIRNLEIDGQHLPVDAVKCEGHADWAHHITLENLLIHRHDHNQQIVAISTKCPAWQWVIRNNVIRGAGTGLYLGNSDGRAPFIAGLIEYNLITDTLGYNLQITYQRPRPHWPGMPGDSSNTVIRHNVFSKADNNGAKESARPNVLVGHWPLSGIGQDDQYLIYGNFFYQNPYESLFQGEGNIALYNNVFVNHWGNGIRIQPHRDIPRSVSVFFNTILAAGGGIHLTNRDRVVSFPQSVLNNAIFAERPLTGAAAANKDNFAEGFKAAQDYLVQPFLTLGQMNLAPRPRKMSQMQIDIAQTGHYPEWNRDFAGRLSDHRFGAYAYDAPLSWFPRLAIKPRSGP